MSFNKISYARNRLSEARAAIGKIQLDPEAYSKLLILLIGADEFLGKAIAILEARASGNFAGETHESEID